MDLNPGFSYQPTPPNGPTPPGGSTPPPPPIDPGLGPLTGLLGTWVGTGFNSIWRPAQGSTDHFLELNSTTETLEVQEIPGLIPNRGALQGDLFMRGVRYTQQVTDSNVLGADGTNAGLHIETGMWLNVPATTDPEMPATVVRLGSVPHGTGFVAQGQTNPPTTGPLALPTNTSITPFKAGPPIEPLPAFAEQTLATASQSRTGAPGSNDVIQAWLDNPNSALVVPSGQITEIVTLQVGSGGSPFIGGGVASTAFLQGPPPPGAPAPNANVTQIEATFWLLTLDNAPDPSVLLYSQRVVLEFNGISWPHISVATLHKASQVESTGQTS